LLNVMPCCATAVWVRVFFSARIFGILAIYGGAGSGLGAARMPISFTDFVCLAVKRILLFGLTAANTCPLLSIEYHGQNSARPFETVDEPSRNQVTRCIHVESRAHKAMCRKLWTILCHHQSIYEPL
jgi:hypothetical protein